VGLSPAFALGVAGAALGLGLVVMLATGHRAERLVMAVRQGVDSEFATAGFKLKTLHVQGASAQADADIRRASGLYLDQPTLGLDLADIRQRVEAVGWVREAKVVRLLPDTVVIAVQERPALAVWQSGGRMRVIDGEGRVISEADAARFHAGDALYGQQRRRAAAVELERRDPTRARAARRERDAVGLDVEQAGDIDFRRIVDRAGLGVGDAQPQAGRDRRE